jgi:DMSO/TMAO reductase YedYZ molybdopterin-dependent catalytic subunit
VAAVAAADRLPDSPYVYLPALLGTATTMVLLAVLAHRAPHDVHPDDAAATASTPTATPTPATPEQLNHTRRQFLALTSGVAVLALAGGVWGRALHQSRAAVEAARRNLRLMLRRLTAPAGVDLGVDGVVPWITDQDDFYLIDTAISKPQILPEKWELRIHGMVDRELTLSYQDLLDRGLSEAWVTLCCVSNEVGGDLIGNARWAGVPIREVLAEAGVQDGADAVKSTSSDGWTCGTPIEALTDDRNALLAVAMNGEPLSVEHGFPVRMVVPGLYGFVSATKWVVELEVTRFADFEAFWTQNGWAEQAPVKTQSRIDVPADGATVAAGQVAVGGIAWAQHRGITAVEVSVDEGPWERAELGADPTIDTWRQWVYRWDATPGEHQLQVRATDATGEPQTGDEVGVVPDGATGWHTIDVSVS